MSFAVLLRSARRRKARSAFGALAILAVLHAGQAFAQAALTISSVTPSAVKPDSVVTISGAGFNAAGEKNIVHIGGVRATVEHAEAGFLFVSVPHGMQHGLVTLVNTDTRQRVTYLSPLNPMSTVVVGRALRPGDFVREVKDSDATAGTMPVFASADLNGDGRPDIVTARNDGSDDGVYVRLSLAGTSNHGDAVRYATTVGGIAGLDIGDIDNDGLLDIAALSAANDQFVVLRNTGTVVSPAFTPASPVNVPNAAANLRIADFDNDGLLDVVVVRDDAKVVVLRNVTSTDDSVEDADTSDIAFDEQTAIDTVDQAVNLAVGEFTSPDNNVDILLASSTGVRLLTGNGNLGFNVLEPVAGLPGQPSAVIPANINGDTKLDAVVSFVDGASVEVGVLYNSWGPTGFEYRAVTTETGSAQAVAVGELTGDELSDIVVARTGASTTQFSVYRNTSTVVDIQFDAMVELTSTLASLPGNLLVADLEADGKADVLAVHQDGTLTQFFNRAVVAPTTQATNIQVAAGMLMPTSATITWTRGSGDKVVVFMAEASAGTPAPVDATDYTASTTFGSGTQIGTTGWFTVANGTAASVTVTGLEQNKTYRAMVVEYNTNSFGTNVSYRTTTATGNPHNFTTPVPVSVTALARASSSPTADDIVDYTLTLGGDVHAGMGAARFSLTTSGLTGASIASVTGSGSTWTISVNTGTGNGTVTLNLDTDTGIVPGITGLPFVGETYTIDRTPPPPPPPPPPPETIVTGNQNGVDLVGPVYVIPGAQIDGGNLSGAVYNSGLITGTITLGANTTIQGGTISGTISGAPSSPALLQGVTIPADTVLTNVVIGAGTVLSPDAVIGEGVRFESRSEIPPGLDLTGALGAFRWSADSPLVVVDLGSDVLKVPTVSILQALQTMATDDGNTLDESPNGELLLDMENARGMFLPVRVRQAAPGTAPGTYVDDDGNVLFVTGQGYEVLAYPVLFDDARFEGELAGRGMSLAYDAQGRLIVTPDDHDRFRFFGRAGAVAVPAAADADPGLHERAGGLVLVFEDEDGVLMEQLVVPVAADWPALRDTLAAMPGVSDVTLGVHGTITVAVDGRRVSGHMGYQVADTIADFPAQPAILSWAGDLNGDGTGDYYVFYPRESRVQVLFVNP